MTLEIFMAQLHVYYGVSKNPNMPKYVRRYIEKDHKPDMYDNVLQAVFYSHKAGYGYPDIATIEDAVNNARLYKNAVDTHKLKEGGCNQKSNIDAYRQDAIDNPKNYIPIPKEFFSDLLGKINDGTLSKEKK